MKAAVVSSADLATFGRMDPGFHLAHQEAKDRIQALEKAMSVEQARALGQELLDTLPLAQAVSALAPLRRGKTNRTAGKEELQRLVGEYPWLALARLEAVVAPAMEASARQVQDLQDQEQRLSDLRSRLPAAAPSRAPRMG